MKEFEVYIQNHDFSSVRYNYKSTMNFMDIREVPKDLRVPYLGRTRKSAVRDIKLIHYNFHSGVGLPCCSTHTVCGLLPCRILILIN